MNKLNAIILLIGINEFINQQLKKMRTDLNVTLDELGENVIFSASDVSFIPDYKDILDIKGTEYKIVRRTIELLELPNSQLCDCWLWVEKYVR